MEWMLDIQLGRRNLSPIQRIAVAEKYRPIYEKMAKENQGTRNDLKNIMVNLPESSTKNITTNPTTSEKLAQIAGVSEKTYRMGAKVLNSDNEDVKNRVLSGETSISAGYREHPPPLIQSRCFAGFEFNICQNDSFYQLPANLPDFTIS